ncbi:hypothetical protein HELRODRAFT_190293 [Helobdella robusta]|uniref:SH3 domain-containing protein n=1 Tax=Helobdella robusta TaxID=6412 RepID=T1FRV4_HELRO|nr:hypothetical protein HELRODRAFT_190293 [Helobdella robusta]ESO11089.1 hypothetical protein HELRODRAFT_190293 [Helobdella robusta]
MSVSSKPESPPLCSENNKVKVVFDYSYFSKHDNKTLDFKTGEEYYLIKKTSDNWFFVKKNICDPVGVYVPRLCVAELTEPKPVKNLVRLPSTDASKKKIVPLPRPKLHSKNSNEEKETKPALSKVALEELNDIISEIGVPEHFKDDVQTTTANDVFFPENQVAANKCLLSETQSSGSPSTSPVDSSNDKMTTSGAALKSSSDDISSDKNLVLMSTSFIGNQQNEEETKVDSETSDYKTDSRESLRSDGQLLIDNEEVDSDVKPLPISVKDNKGDLTKSSLNNNIPMATNTIQSDDHSLKRTPSTSSHSPSPQLSSIIPRPQLLSTTATTMTSLVKPASEDELDANCLEYTNASSFMKNKKATETEPQLAKVDNSSEKLRKMRNQSMEDYANLGEIQKVIHGMPRPPLAENLMPAGYVKPYSQEKAVLNDAGIVKGAINVDSKHELVEKKGMLNKAKVEESSISKKIKRSWSQSFVILQHGSLSFYKDTKGASVLSKVRLGHSEVIGHNEKSSMSSLGKPEFEIVLKGVKLTSAPEDKNLKKDAFMRLRFLTDCIFHSFRLPAVPIVITCCTL